MEKLQLNIFENMKNFLGKETQTRHQFSEQLQTTWHVSEISYP